MRTLPFPAFGGQFGQVMKSLVAPSPRRLPGLRLALALGSAALVARCGLSDVFAAPGAGAVVFVWEGATDMSVGQVAPISVTVLVNGEPLVGPQLLVTIPVLDTATIDLDASGDSIVAKSVGRGDVVVEVHSSLAAQVSRDTFEVRVTGGPLR